jgi:hypothetical protein
MNSPQGSLRSGVALIFSRYNSVGKSTFSFRALRAMAPCRKKAGVANRHQAIGYAGILNNDPPANRAALLLSHPTIDTVIKSRSNHIPPTFSIVPPESDQAMAVFTIWNQKA